MAEKKTPAKPRAKKAKTDGPQPKRKRRGVKIAASSLGPGDLPLEKSAPDIAELTAAIEADGGAILGAYREPLGGHALVLAALPIDKVRPTPFQRDVSDTHVRKLELAMDKTRRFLDPIIAVREGDGYMTPNGNHRLTAMKELGSQAVIALVVPERSVAYQILALNIEKAHNLRERALEVIRMARDLATFDDRKESECAFEFEEPQLLTLGMAYEARPRFSGGAYSSALKKVDGWIDAPLSDALDERKTRVDQLLALDDAVGEAVARLKERGLVSPYLKAFVVARVNPLRFIKGDLPSYEDLFATMTKRAKGFKVDGIKVEDLARTGGAPADEE